MKKWAKRIGLVCAVLVTAFFLVGFLLMHTVCKDEVTQRALSPSGKYAAEVEESYCTVGSSWDTWVTVRQPPFVLSAQRLGTAFDVLYIYGPATRIRLQWNSNSDLAVECLGCKENEVRESHDRWKDISIHFSITPQAPSAPRSR